ncbi:hypothetical protein H4582DRAFT_2064225 [Lactarius indigo]|nr:hypothetical protein H4582DRAFT_2064225 [Lactarius indigo]
MHLQGFPQFLELQNAAPPSYSKPVWKSVKLHSEDLAGGSASSGYSECHVVPPVVPDASSIQEPIVLSTFPLTFLGLNPVKIMISSSVDDQVRDQAQVFFSESERRKAHWESRQQSYFMCALRAESIGDEVSWLQISGSQDSDIYVGAAAGFSRLFLVPQTI